MHMGQPTAIFLADDDATNALGSRLATLLRPGDVVALSGGLGVGKTALARAVIRSLSGDVLIDVPSPTFALVQPYDAAGVAVVHADLYRLGSERETLELGLLDDPMAIVLIEWPERAPALAAAADIAVSLRLSTEGGREATVAFRDNRRIAA